MFLRLTAKATVPRSSSTLLSITVQSAIEQTLATLCLIFNTSYSRPPHNVIGVVISALRIFFSIMQKNISGKNGIFFVLKSIIQKYPVMELGGN